MDRGIVITESDQTLRIYDRFEIAEFTSFLDDSE